MATHLAKRRSLTGAALERLQWPIWWDAAAYLRSASALRALTNKVSRKLSFKTFLFSVLLFGRSILELVKRKLLQQMVVVTYNQYHSLIRRLDTLCTVKKSWRSYLARRFPSGHPRPSWKSLSTNLVSQFVVTNLSWVKVICILLIIRWQTDYSITKLLIVFSRIYMSQWKKKKSQMLSLHWLLLCIVSWWNWINTRPRFW